MAGRSFARSVVAEPDRRAGGAEGLARGEDHRDHGVLALLTELIFEGLRHVALHTSECTPLLPVLPRFGWCRPGSGGGAFVGRVSKVRILAVTGAEEAGLIPEARGSCRWALSTGAGRRAMP